MTLQLELPAEVLNALGCVDVSAQPNESRSEVKETEVIASQLIKPREAAPEVLEFADKALDEVTFFVKFSVIFA